MEHDHHDHGGNDHSGHEGHNPPSIVTTTVASVVQAIIKNATQAIINSTTTTTASPISHDAHEHHNHDQSEDHSNHGNDHSSHVVNDPSIHDSHAGHEMKMWFHGGMDEVILFDFWRINSFPGLFFSCILIFILGASYEGLKWFRIYLQMKETQRRRHKHRTLSPTQVSMSQLESSVNKRLDGANQSSNHPSEALLTPSNLNGDQVYVSTVKEAEDDEDDATDVGFIKWSTKKSSLFDKVRIIQALLYCIQITIAYFLMLIAMTYNIYLTAAVVFGAGFGHWLFAVLQDSHSNAETTDAVTSDACH